MTFLEQIIAWFVSLFQAWGGTGTITTSSGGSTGGSQAPSGQTGNRHLITEPERITARFHDTGSPAWVNQWRGTPMAGQHGGTDFAAPSGTIVYAPYSMKVIAIGYYPDDGRRGWYVIGTLPDGAEYYSGHLNNVTVRQGELVGAGTPIGQTWAWWADAGRPHTHIQIKVRGQIVDPEQYFASH